MHNTPKKRKKILCLPPFLVPCAFATCVAYKSKDSCKETYMQLKKRKEIYAYFIHIAALFRASGLYGLWNVHFKRDQQNIPNCDKIDLEMGTQNTLNYIHDVLRWEKYVTQNPLNCIYNVKYLESYIWRITTRRICKSKHFKLCIWYITMRRIYNSKYLKLYIYDVFRWEEYVTQNTSNYMYDILQWKECVN